MNNTANLPTYNEQEPTCTAPGNARTAGGSDPRATVPTYHESTLGHVAHCKGCGAYYTPDTWRELPIVGVQDPVGIYGGPLELRNCTCTPKHGPTHYTLVAEMETRL